MSDYPDYYYTQSAVVPYRKRKGKLEILTITSRKSGRWIVPKGVVEPDLSAADSAAKEAWEEAGVIGTVYRKALGKYRYEKWGGVCTVTVYAMAVESELRHWPEEDRTREWVSVKEAADRVREKEMKSMIKALSKQLKKISSNGK